MLTNKTINLIRKLKQKKYREKLGLFWVEGHKGVEEALKSKTDILNIIISKSADEVGGIVKQAIKKGVTINECTDEDAQKIKTTVSFPGVGIVCKKRKIELSNLINDKPIIALDNISDPGNLGTIIRTGDWFGVENFIISEGSVDLYNPKVVRSTMGSIFHTQCFVSTNFKKDLEKLKENKYSICNLDLAGKPLKLIKKKTRSVYVFGSESHGIRKEILGLGSSYAIEGKGQAESLNVAVSAGILMSQL